MGCLLGAAIDALVLMVLLKLISEEELEFKTGFIIALVASIGVGIVSAVGLLVFAFAALAVTGIDPTDQSGAAESPLVIVASITGLLLGAAVGAHGLGAALSKIFGLEIKRAFLIGAIFTAAHFGRGIRFQFIFGGLRS